MASSNSRRILEKANVVGVTQGSDLGIFDQRIPMKVNVVDFADDIAVSTSSVINIWKSSN